MVGVKKQVDLPLIPSDVTPWLTALRAYSAHVLDLTVLADVVLSHTPICTSFPLYKLANRSGASNRGAGCIPGRERRERERVSVGHGELCISVVVRTRDAVQYRKRANIAGWTTLSLKLFGAVALGNRLTRSEVGRALPSLRRYCHSGCAGPFV